MPSQQTLAELAGALKEFYLPGLRKQLNNNILLSQILKADKSRIEGLKAVFSTHMSRAGGTGSRGEGDDLPGAGAQKAVKGEFDLAYHYGHIQVTGQAISRSASKAGAFIDAWAFEADGIKDDLALDMARQMYGDGSAVIATVPTGAAGATQTINSAEPLRKGYLYINLPVDIGTAANPVSAGSRTITGFSYATPSITLDSTVTTANGDGISVKGNREASSVVNEMPAGLQNLVSATAGATVGNISSTTYQIWDNERDTSGGALDLDKMLILHNKLLSNGAEWGKITAVTSLGLQRAYYNLLKSQVQILTPTRLAGGYEYLEFQGLKLTGDRLHPWGKIHFLDTGSVVQFQNGEWDFLARDGQPIKWVQNKDAFQSLLFKYASLGTDRRNTSAVMSGLTDTGF